MLLVHPLQATAASAPALRGRATMYATPPATHEVLAVPIVAEELHIGTRQVDTGGIHVETHVEAIPVEEQVTVRTEQVHIERGRICHH
jgi:stress response protein YsnF